MGGFVSGGVDALLVLNAYLDIDISANIGITIHGIALTDVQMQALLQPYRRLH
jgi:hypothetical protein